MASKSSWTALTATIATVTVPTPTANSRVFYSGIRDVGGEAYGYDHTLIGEINTTVGRAIITNEEYSSGSANETFTWTTNTGNGAFAALEILAA